MRSTWPTVRVRFVDGPLAGVERMVVAGPGGVAPLIVSAPVSDPGLGLSAVVYERFDTPAVDGSARYRVAPISA